MNTTGDDKSYPDMRMSTRSKLASKYLEARKRDGKGCLCKLVTTWVASLRAY